MELNRVVLSVGDRQANNLEECTRTSAIGAKRNEILFDREAIFSDGVKVRIKMFAAHNPIFEPAWTEGVLTTADGAAELTLRRNRFLGDYAFELPNGRKYTAVIDTHSNN